MNLPYSIVAIVSPGKKSFEALRRLRLGKAVIGHYNGRVVAIGDIKELQPKGLQMLPTIAAIGHDDVPLSSAKIRSPR